MRKSKIVFISFVVLFVCMLNTANYTVGGASISNNTSISAIDAELVFSLPSNSTSKFNLGDSANVYKIGSKLIVLSTVPLKGGDKTVKPYKEVAYKYMYIININEEVSKVVTTISAIQIPSKSAVSIKDNLIFVNKDNALPKNYLVNEKDLVDLKKLYKCKSTNGITKVRYDYAEALKQMFIGAKSQGNYNFICNSGYRSLEYQQQLFNAILKDNLAIYKDKDKALKMTKLRVAYAGTSEHNLGIALDIFQYPNCNSDTFGSTKEAKWLKENCYKYGFIVRYPANKTALTYTMYEPWHIRYVGLPYSKLFQNSGLCFEEIVQKLRKDNYIFMSDEKDKYILFYSKTSNLYCPKDNNIQRSILTHNNEYVTLIKL